MRFAMNRTANYTEFVQGDEEILPVSNWTRDCAVRATNDHVVWQFQVTQGGNFFIRIDVEIETLTGK